MKKQNIFFNFCPSYKFDFSELCCSDYYQSCSRNCTSCTYIFFPLQNEIRYRTVGYFPATDFFTLNEFTGAIRLIRSVMNEQYRSLVYVVSMCYICTKTCLKQPLKNITINSSLMKVKSITECSLKVFQNAVLEHSAIL